MVETRTARGQEDMVRFLLEQVERRRCLECKNPEQAIFPHNGMKSNDVQCHRVQPRGAPSNSVVGEGPSAGQEEAIHSSEDK